MDSLNERTPLVVSISNKSLSAPPVIAKEIPASEGVTTFTELATLPTNVPGAVTMEPSKVNALNEVSMLVLL